MPPKRRGGAAKGGAAAKKAKKGAAAAANDDPAPSTLKDAVAALKAADAGKKKSGGKVDQYVSLPASSSAVYEDYDCMLNQTNIGHNNNKYYVIQVLACYNNYYAFNRWGRVGEPGQTKLSGPFGDSAKAISEFKKKFKDKTKNDWDNRASFKPIAGKYTLIEMDDDDEDDAATAEKCAKLDAIDGVKKTVLPCSLDKPTQDLVKLIFDQDMFKEAMASFDIDVKKMPLGKLSKSQIAKGFECLEEIEEGMKKKNHNTLQALTSRFYTLIPHDFGRKRPPIIGDEETLRKKKDMLLVLGDIELATSMQKAQSESYTGEEKSVPHPYDENYSLLKCDLDVVEKKSNEFKLIENYTKATDGGRNLKIKEVWKVNRDGEAGRFAAHDKTGNRKLLWHGTNVAVVAAILKSGLRIMPHSGGRVGRGIYFASENSKSAGYVGCAGNTGIMFLNEVVLGKEHLIKHDDWRLTAAPKGHDCIIAKGWTEPDPKQDKTLEIEGHTVVVPQGKPITQLSFRDSSFSQSEYLVYKESQARIRYLLKLEF